MFSESFSKLYISLIYCNLTVALLNDHKLLNSSCICQYVWGLFRVLLPLLGSWCPLEHHVWSFQLCDKAKATDSKWRARHLPWKAEILVGKQKTPAHPGQRRQLGLLWHLWLSRLSTVPSRVTKTTPTQECYMTVCNEILPQSPPRFRGLYYLGWISSLELIPLPYAWAKLLNGCQLRLPK